MDILTKCVLIILSLFITDKPLQNEAETIVKPPKEQIEVCNTQTSFVSFMDYRAITNTSSIQWEIQQQAYTSDQGYRMIDDYRLVAMAERYAPLKSRYTVTLENGAEIKIMIGDIKANSYCTHDDTSMIEAIVDTNLISQDVWNYGSITDMRYRVTKIEKED